MLLNDLAKYRHRVLLFLFVIFFASIVFTLRGISSISIGLILLVGIAGVKWSDIKNDRPWLFFFACSLLFIFRCISLAETEHLKEGMANIQRSSGLALIPLALICCKGFLNTERHKKLMTCFAALLFVASFICIAVAVYRYFQTGSSKFFIFHELVKPVHQHAVQFSIYVFTVLIFLITSLLETRRKALLYAAIAYFTLLLILLASRLVLGFYLLFLAYHFLISKVRHRKNYWSLFLIAIATIFAAVVIIKPVRSRFTELFSGNHFLFTQKKFGQDVYLNGFQFRLLHWRLVPEILNENHAWLTGVGPGDAQSLLDQKYRAADLYTGPVGDYPHGYLGLHTHNEFLQVLLETGIVGLLLFLLVCFSLTRMAVRSKSNQPGFFTALLLAYCFTDAVPETQYGLVIFTFFPIFIFLSLGGEERGNQTGIS